MFWQLFEKKNFVQVVNAMGPRPPFSKCVFSKIKIMTYGRSFDVISDDFSPHFLELECYFFH